LPVTYLLPLKIQLSTEQDWDPSLIPIYVLCLSQARTWISNVICLAFYFVSELRWEVVVRFVDICGIVDRQFHYFNFLFRYRRCKTKWLVKLVKLYTSYPIVFSEQVKYLILIMSRHIEYNTVGGHDGEFSDTRG